MTEKVRTLFRRNHLTHSSVKEALDNLPSGICFFSKVGLPVLCNRVMHQIVFDMTGTDLQSLFELRGALSAPDEGRGVRCLDSERRVYIFPDNTVRRFSEKNITDENGDVYIQVVAGDVTELMAQEQQLRERQRSLAAATAKLEELRRNARNAVQEEQALSMKIRIHDDLGACIAAAHQCLVQGKTPEEIRQNSQLRKEAISALLQRQQTVRRETLASVRAKASDIGVSLCLQGELPTDKETEQTLLRAILECANNCAKHAQGTELTVTLRRTGGAQSAELTNNGKPPSGPVTEGGGLSALRQRVESMGGAMRIECRPAFQLTLQFSGEEAAEP